MGPNKPLEYECTPFPGSGAKRVQSLKLETSIPEVGVVGPTSGRVDRMRDSTLQVPVEFQVARVKTDRALTVCVTRVLTLPAIKSDLSSSGVAMLV